jgi:flagellar assembly protein FliH
MKPAKYLFDLDFGGGAGSPAAEPMLPMREHRARLAEAEAVAFRNGVAAAEMQAMAESDRRSAAALDRIACALDALARGLRAAEARLETEAVDVAFAVAKKLAPALIAREPFAEIAALASECFSHLIGAPHVVVRVNDAQHAEAGERIEAIARARGFDGRLVVLAEPEIAPGDCRIEWADGGIRRDRAGTEAVIAESVGRYVKARTVRPDAPIRDEVEA